MLRELNERKDMLNEDRTQNLFLAGVGGQGTILASSVMAHAFMQAGYDVKKAEVHGMAQRGGDVTTHFRFGRKVYSPIIKQGDVDYLVAFELLEGLRYLDWVKPEGMVILNNHKILPPSVSLGKAEYPADIEKTFRKFFKDRVWVINGWEIAEAIGNHQVVNIVILGALSNFFPQVKPEQWTDAIKDLLPSRLHEINILAFNEGRAAINI